MGDRVVYTMEQADGLTLNLYSHWGGSDRFTALAMAIDKARPRWSDETYCARIITSQLINQFWDEETGYGLWAGRAGEGSMAGEYPDLIISLTGNTVTDETGTHSFDEFVNYHIGAKV